MFRNLLAALTLLILAGCAVTSTPTRSAHSQLTPVTGKSVIYIVRDRMDHNPAPATLWLDSGLITLHMATYTRWEVAPGQHNISGTGPDTGKVTLNTEAGKVYFVQHNAMPGYGNMYSYIRGVSENTASTIIARSEFVQFQRSE